MSKVDTLKAAIDYIRKLQKALDADDDISETTSETDLSDSSQSPSSQCMASPTTSDSMYTPTYTHPHSQPMTTPQTYNYSSTDGYQPQCTQFYNTAMSKDSFHIDYTRPVLSTDTTCPSPTSSYYSIDSQNHLSAAEAEAEILEFASSWLY